MHVPDNYLSNEVCATAGLISLVAVGWSIRKLEGQLADKTIPLTGMMAALIFSGQMVNFPLPGLPVSGHLLGGVLAAAVLGPWAGCLAITLVLVLQTFLFGDGGKLSLGVNILHMGVIGSLGGYAIYATLRRWLGVERRGTLIAAAGAAFLSVLAAAALFCLEFHLTWGSRYDLGRIYALMVGYHAVIGICEAWITVSVLGFLLLQRPDLIYQPSTPTSLAPRWGRALVAGGVVALAIAAFVAPFASELPDGLDAVAETIGFKQLEGEPASAVLGDYKVPLPIADWSESSLFTKVSTALAGLIGAVLLLALSLLAGRALRSRPVESSTSHVE